jgi:hypothetical protein
LKFDYQSKLGEAPPSTAETEPVVSLVNPTETESYEIELWKVFKQTRSDAGRVEKRMWPQTNGVHIKDV